MPGFDAKTFQIEFDPAMHPLETWLKCRRSYIEGKGSLPHVARLYGLPVATVQTRGKREAWSAARAEYIKRKTELPEVELPPAPQPPPDNPDYLAQRLHRVRLQLQRIDELVEAETDPNRLDRLVSAQSRLAEQERIMASRPLPGSRRPGREAIQRRGPRLGSLDDEPLEASPPA